MSTFKDKLRNGDTVSLINVNHPSLGVVDVVSRLGIDAFMFDCEQGNLSYADVEYMGRAAQSNGVGAIARIPSPEPWIIERTIMRGVDGLVIPRLDTADQAQRAIADIRYASPSTFARKVIIVQIETVPAVQELDDFLSLSEVDCFFVGAVDLAKSMGYDGDYSQPAVQAKLQDVVSRIVARGRTAGFLVKENDMAYWQSQGVTMLYSHVNEFLSLGVRHWRLAAGLPV
ncbi:HpcH/HpaI aldolase family protein [Bordetella sp. 02P26C-1]|uniref:HpcH/HpaI aldolase family protein n=1 Tax=Bordetella sp. 02P26C-1 TaxID=2683195 RepID=UPI00135322EB|nr:aldolase/citrate lyase family protein [Bordetella sp. 02P26C-1]MVW78108.1 2,4-dihydroxyhept-2-ene-1,7-dioic acid aldolase [Bordetella sp. 02P26C-1]